MGRGASIGDFVLVTVERLLMKGDAQINAGAKLVGANTVRLGYGAVVGFNAILLTSTDQPNANMFDEAPTELRNVKHGDITVGDYAFVGSGSIVFPGVTIGEGAVVGAGTVLKEDLGPWTIIKPDYRAVTKTSRQMRCATWKRK